MSALMDQYIAVDPNPLRATQLFVEQNEDTLLVDVLAKEHNCIDVATWNELFQCAKEDKKLLFYLVR